MNKRYLPRLRGAFLLCGVLSIFLMACNSKPEDEPGYEDSTSVAVTNFRLKPDRNVMLNLDSVFFSIDLEHGIIYNADSLPMGTPVSSLVPVISYPSDCSSAVISMRGGAIREGDINYMSTPNDTVDFTGDVTLTLRAQDGVTERSYRLKVNVHKVKPDSLTFDRQATGTLPSRLGSPLAQKSVAFGGGVLSIIEEKDRSFTLATSAKTTDWIKFPLSLPFTPDLRSLTSGENALYMLADNGDLYTSTDGSAWAPTGKNWNGILGAYGSDLLGLRKENGKFFHTSLSGLYPEAEIPEGFPVTGQTNMLTLTNNWAVDPVGFITGGLTASGDGVRGTWGFDGHTWAMISTSELPELHDACAVPYFVYKQTSTIWRQTEFPVMMLFGGVLADGSLNDKTYISIDNGINWSEAPENLSLPADIPAVRMADAVILSTPMQGSLTDAWEDKPNKIRQRLNYKIEGYDISWECPYIYIFGGMTKDDRLNDIVWRGVLARLTFMPLI